jgi:hypothetical protein
VKTIAWAERRGSLLVSSVLGDIVPELDVAAGEDAALGPPHDDLAVGQHVLHRLHHLSGQLPLAAHAPHHLLVHLPRPERHLRSRLRYSCYDGGRLCREVLVPRAGAGPGRLPHCG